MRPVEQYPLAIDLDGTLLRIDSLIEMFVVSLLRQPHRALLALLALFSGRASFKKRVFEINLTDVTLYPVHKGFIDYLHEEKRKGRLLHLVTAADQQIADRIAAQLDIFDDHRGSVDGHNLKGRAKLAFLRQRFPDGFAYAGDSSADIPIWREAASIVLVNTSPVVRRSLGAAEDRIEREFPREPAGLRVWLKALRPHQWTKNILVFVPLFLAHKYGDPVAVASAVAAFLCIGLVASGTYVINDLSDLDADRVHPTKRDRALASGRIGAGRALVAAVACIAAGLAGALSVSAAFLVLLVTYLVITFSYSIHLKRVVMLDVVILGALYTLRIMMGTAVIGVALSPWLLMFSLFFFLGFSLAKRYVEIVGTGADKDGDAFIKGRGYKYSDGPLLLAFGVSTSIVAILILSLYIVNEAFPIGAYNHPQWLWLITPIVLLWTMRIWLLCYRGDMHDDPVAFAIRDRTSWGLGVLVMLAFFAATQ